jgi:hypothetical protein
MAFTEDLTVFLADFGETVTLDGVSVTAVFDVEYVRADAGPLGMASTSPALTVPTDSVPASPIGKPVVARSVSYTIAEHISDGTGMSILILEAA